jgi:hypothetical protein
MGRQAVQAKLSHGPELDKGGKAVVLRKLLSVGKAKAALPRSETRCPRGSIAFPKGSKTLRRQLWHGGGPVSALGRVEYDDCATSLLCLSKPDRIGIMAEKFLSP